MKKFFAFLIAILSLCNLYSASDEYSVFYGKLSVKDVVAKFLEEKQYLTKTELCEIMTLWGSDKGSRHHNYTTLYSQLFDEWRNTPLAIFELGLGTNNVKLPSNMTATGVPGASLFGWSTFLPESLIFGADIDRDILFNKGRIKTFYCDQRDRFSIEAMFSNPELEDISFDFILDDGLHEYNANKTFLECSIHKLKKGGVYIVEDIYYTNCDAIKKLLPHFKKMYSLEYIDLIAIPCSYNRYDDNRILIIQK